MAGLTRYLQKLFGISAGANEMAEYGSFLSTPQLYDGATITPAIIQALSNFQQGLYGAVGGAYSPTIQDQNSLFFLAFYQLSYLLTRGIPEWDSATTYNTNDICKVGNILYYSLIDSNTNNNPASSITDWQNNSFIAPTQQVLRGGSGTYTLPTSPRKPLYLIVQMWGAGGGGQGAGIGAPGSDGGDGNDSTFGSGYLVAGGGKGGGPNPGAGGTSTSSNVQTLLFNGQNGGTRCRFEVFNVGGAGSRFNLPGGIGGNSLFAGGATGNSSGAFTGASASAERGGGGSGATVDADFSATSGLAFSGHGGGAGGSLIEIIYNPNSTYPYDASNIVGAGGAGVGGGAAGGDGGSGLIIVTEYYQ